MDGYIVIMLWLFYCFREKKKCLSCGGRNEPSHTVTIIENKHLLLENTVNFKKDTMKINITKFQKQ